MIDDENKPKGIAAYAQRLKDLPAADGAAYPQRTGLSAVATEPRLGFQSQASRPTWLAAAATPQLGALKPQGIAAPAAMPTSEPGISKVTGIAGALPLYTNMGSGQNQSDTKPAQQGIAAGFDLAKAAQYSNPPAGPGLGFSPNEGIARMSAANSTRQSMIDAQPRGGFSVLGGLDAMGRTRQEQENDAKSARWRQDALISEAKYRPQISGIAGEAIRGDNQQAVEGMRQQGIAAGMNNQRRGQDLGFAAQMRQQSLAERGQDLNAATGIAKLGIEQGRFGLEQSTMQRQQSAQDNLARAMESGDQNTIARARAMATMAGVKVPESTKLETVQTDSGFMVFNPASGEMRPAVVAGGQPVGSGKPLTEGQAKAAGFGMRAAESSRIIEQVGKGGVVQPSLIKRAAESVPLIGEGLGMLANQLASPEQQQIEQAQRDFINAVLRQESGAVIADSEFANARKQYFPAPGDSQEVIEQKQRNREMAINGFRVTAGPAAKNIGNPPAQQQPQQGQQQSAAAPVAGTVDGGYVFLGGNPNDPNNWVEARK